MLPRLSKLISLTLLPLSLGNFFFVLSSFPFGRPRSECRDMTGSVGEREGNATTRRPGANSGMFWEQSSGISWDTLWGLSPSAAGRSWGDLVPISLSPWQMNPLGGEGEGDWKVVPLESLEAEPFSISLSTPGPAV